MPLSQELIDKANSVLLEWSNEATAEMQRLLNERLKKTAQESMLSQSINFEGTEAFVGGVTATWSLDDYYVYVDLGVKGYQNKSKTYTSVEFPQGFQFKNYGKKPKTDKPISGAPSPMVAALQNYISRKGIQVIPKGGKSVIEESFSMAKTMTYFIKKKGTDGTRFYSDVFNDKGFKRLTDKLERSIGGEFEVKIIAQLKE